MACEKIADIGADHGYLSAHILLEGLASRAILTDIAPGPLSSAHDTFSKYGLCDHADFRLGGGLSVISESESKEIDACFITGMGGMTIISILEESLTVAKSIGRFVLSPERDAAALRRFLHVSGFEITDETLTFEGGHYYFAISAQPTSTPTTQYSDIDYLFGAKLLEKRDETLYNYLVVEKAKTQTLLHPRREKIRDFYAAIERAINYINRGSQ